MGLQASDRAAMRVAIQEMLKKKIPTDINSDDKRFPGMTGGMSTTWLKERWAKGSIVTSCNSFAGWVAGQIGVKSSSVLARGYLDISKADGEVPGCWNWANTDEAIDYDLHPQAGDFYAGIYRGTDKAGHEFVQEFGHVGIVYDFDETTQQWTLVQGGQGGPSSGKDWIKWKTAKFDRSKLTGWVDMAYYMLPNGPDGPDDE